MEIRKEMPPVLFFDYAEVGIDAEASEKAGRPIPLVRAVAKIMQRGDKFSEHQVIFDDWIAQKNRDAIEGRYNPEWVAKFKAQYEAFLKGEELPTEGTPIKTWAAVTREQVIRLIAVGIPTVEELAAYPDSGLGNIGLDGRYLRDLAKNFISSAMGPGKTAKQIADLEQSNRDKDETIKRMQAQLAALEASQKTLHVKKQAA